MSYVSRAGCETPFLSRMVKSFQVKVHRAVAPAWMNGCYLQKTWGSPALLEVHPGVCRHHLKQPPKIWETLHHWGGRCLSIFGVDFTKSTIYKAYENLLKFAFAGQKGREVLPEPSFSIKFPDLSLAEECLRNGGRWRSYTYEKPPEEWWLGDDPFLGKGP